METKKDTLEKRGRPSGLWRPVVLIVVVITALILARTLGIGERLGELRDWIQSLGFWGPLVFILLYAIAAIAAIPGSAITVAGGALFGSFLGVILVSIASTLGASLSFLIARYFARDAVSNWLSKKEKFRRLDQLTREQGAIIVALTRLVPIFPFNLLNYGFGLTGVPFWTYVFWSWLCMIPGTVLYVVGADAVTRGVARGEVPWVLIGVLIIAITIITLLVRTARKRLQSNE